MVITFSCDSCGKGAESVMVSAEFDLVGYLPKGWAVIQPAGSYKRIVCSLKCAGQWLEGGK